MSTDFLEAYRNNRSTDTVRAYANSHDGEGVTITYAYGLSVSRHHFHRVEPDFSSGDRWYWKLFENTAKAALEAWSQHANITFREAELDEPVQLGLAYSSHANGSSQRPVYLPDGMRHTLASGETRGLLYFDPAKAHRLWNNAKWWWSHETFEYPALKAVGEVLGLRPQLSNPEAGVPQLSKEERLHSIMSTDVFGDGAGDSQPGMPPRIGFFDRIAIQSIYGPNKATNVENNTYTFIKDGQGQANKLIADAGGNDTFTAADAKANVHINLNDGSWSWVGKQANSLLKPDQMWIGHFSMIENATGSRHNDTLIGNELKNVLFGGAGKDTIQAQAGDDRLFGEGGNDVLEGGAGDDVLYGGPGNDIFEGGAGADVIHLGGGSNRVVIKAITHMGTPEAPDRILSFSGSDKIDFRKIDGSSDQKGDQKLKFLGNSNTDMVLAGKRSGQFYFNTDSRDLRFDADADGTVDRVIEIPDMKAMKAAYFLL